MLSDKDAMIKDSVLRFFEDLSEWKQAGSKAPIPDGLDMENTTLRKGVLPFAVLETRLTDRHHDIADLIDLTLTKIHWSNDLEAILSKAPIVADLEQALDCLCYVGFRRAQFISSRRFAVLVEDKLNYFDFKELSSDRLSGLQVRYLMALLALCRARLDTQDREYFAEACIQILNLLLDRGYNHVTVQNTYSIIRWFAHTGRIQPASHSQFIALSREFARRYLDSGKQLFPLNKMKDQPAHVFLKNWLHLASQKIKGIKNPGNNIVTEVAIATSLGRKRYAYDAIAYLRNKRAKTKDKAIRQRMEIRMVEVAYNASHDEIYGDWSATLRKYLLNNHFHTFSHYINATLMRFGRFPRAEKEINRRRRLTLRARNEEAILYRYTSRFEKARAMFKEIMDYGKDNLFARGYHEKPPSDRFSIMSMFWPVRMYDEMEYLIAVDKAVKAGQSKSPADDSLIVLCPMSFTAFTQIPVHVLADLKGRGCQVISMTPGYIKSDRVSKDIDLNVSNSIYPHYYSDRTSLKKNPTPKAWKINLDQRLCEYRGINFYYTLHNTLGIISRGYDIDWKSPIYNAYVRRYQTAIESMFDKHERVLNHCIESGRKAKFLLTEIQHGLAHALRLIAEKTNSSDHIEIFHICNGFESYHTKLERSQSAQFQCISNLTRHTDVSLAYRPPVDVFEDWHQTASPKRRRAPAALAYAKKVDSQATSLEFKGKLRFPGRPVIMLLGKILPDLPRPNDVGFIHEDVKEWFLDCCRFAAENQINLLVKPHPAEHNSQVSLYVNQEFLSFLTLLPSDQHPTILDRHSYPITGVRDMIDGIIMWGGNSPVETGLLKIPTMISGYYGAMDCPTGQFVSNTRQAFEDFLLGNIDKSGLDDVREKTISFLSYVLHPNHTIPSRFNNRSQYNAEVWPPVLYPETPELKKYGRKMADYILGDHDAIVPTK